jgi:hypothetical protein
MNHTEREQLKNLDNLILFGSKEELEKIQNIDRQNQLEGHSLCDIYLDSTNLIDQKIKNAKKSHS